MTAAAATETAAELPSVAELLDRAQARRESGPWVPACNKSERPFQTRTGKRLLYCFQPSTGKHAYLDCGTDMFLSDEDAQLALGNF